MNGTQAAVLWGVLSALPVLIALHMARGIAPLFVVMALGALVAHLWPRPVKPVIWKGYVYLLGGLCLWALVSAFWAFDPPANGLGALRLCLLMAGGLLLLSVLSRLEGERLRLYRRAFFVSYVCLIALIVFDLVSDREVMRFSYLLRGMTPGEDFNFNPDSKHRAVMLSLLLAPAFSAAMREWGLKAALSLAGVVVGVVYVHHSETAIICLAGLFTAFLFAFALPRLAKWVGLAGLAVLFAAPLLLHDRLPEPVEIQRANPWMSASLLHRILIWDYAMGRIAERPVLGFGFDAAREIGGREPKRHYQFDNTPDGRPLRPYFEPIPLHTHNGVIQIWLELGMVGALLGGALLTLIWKRSLEKADPWQRALSAGLFTAAMMPMLSSYGLFQNWWVGSVWIALAALQASERS